MPMNNFPGNDRLHEESAESDGAVLKPNGVTPSETVPLAPLGVGVPGTGRSEPGQAGRETQRGLEGLPQGSAPTMGAPPLKRAHPSSPLPVEAEHYQATPRHLILSAALLAILLSVVMTLPFVPGQVEITAGMPAPKDILPPTYL